MRNHDKLIETLSRDARPVRRMPATLWRVTCWIASALPAGALASWQLRHALTDWTQPGAISAAAAMLLAFISGSVAIFSALNLSIAGRSAVKARWLVLLILSWLITTLLNTGLQPTHPLQAGEGMHCYQFMLTASLPMMFIAILCLRRTRSLFPVRSLMLAGCGIAFMTATLLAFCHPVVLERADLLMHLAAALTIIVLTPLVGYRWVALN
ncbi:DUF1109 domain-containing protein [Erwinia sp. OLTSP20]|uniref:DUF1109 domain-containing protein n=1 Tax=unclassified Erwinia TaxID=2622719 RepID=UPI000C196C8C|nr:MULTISPECIES: DUF1109 domain-containing protein [unclassified Erwinia]PIJ50333.1 DUF1109 domain-containing protein [Erwinia sp. OAMSP11]PIJ72170.1 DUF1109 domain-containing protein [Erwinia sp. OLSSP12]PIJ81461.1 DUF1109 domain-containing protein [Erwinia sp. OLCASP19]PIJ84167.1 DUF1109 domain-containing protein [Erwinia sp. OLMTSP26]PIJ85866.1 DUF1109 domain-containing protein [Erwinia sp. OLMDSP33]